MKTKHLCNAYFGAGARRGSDGLRRVPRIPDLGPGSPKLVRNFGSRPVPTVPRTPDLGPGSPKVVRLRWVVLGQAFQKCCAIWGPDGCPKVVRNLEPRGFRRVPRSPDPRPGPLKVVRNLGPRLEAPEILRKAPQIMKEAPNIMHSSPSQRTNFCTTLRPRKVLSLKHSTD